MLFIRGGRLSEQISVEKELSRIIDRARGKPEYLCNYVQELFPLFDKLIGETIEKEVEEGGTICDDGKFILDMMKAGEREEVEVPFRCSRGIPVGSYHTHPKGDLPEPSQWDWEAYFDEKHRIACIGAQIETLSRVYDELREVKQNQVRCYWLNVDHPEFPEFRRRILEMSRELDKLNEETFNYLTRGLRPPDIKSDRWLTLRRQFRETIQEAKRRGIIRDLEDLCKWDRYEYKKPGRKIM